MRMLNRQTIAICCHQLTTLLESVTDPTLRQDLLRAWEDLIRQDEFQAMLSGLQDFMGDQPGDGDH